jgi:hypothetical protein
MTILQTINEYLLLLLSTPQALKFYMSSKCLQKLTWASRKPFPSDKLRTIFGHFLACSKWYLAPGRAGVPAKAWVSTWVSGSGFGVWVLGFGVWGFKLLRKLSFAQFLLKTLRSRKQSEALTEAGRKKKQFPRIYLKIVIRGFS